MITDVLVRWNENESKVHLDLQIDEAAHINAKMYNGRDTCITDVFDKNCNPGIVTHQQELKDIPGGIYIMKITSEQEDRTIRFKIH